MRAIDALAVTLRAGNKRVAVDPAVLVGDLLEDGDGRVLGALDGAHKLAGLVERLHGAGIEPGVASTESDHGERAVLEVHPVEVGDLELAARGGCDPLRALCHVARVEVEAGDGVGALRALRLLLDGDRAAVLVELHHAEALRVVHVVAEDGGEALPRVRDGAAEVPAEAVAEEDVVAEHEGAGLARDEALADEEGLGEAVRRGLLGVGERDAEVGTVAQQALEVGQVRRRRDDEDVADARHHEDGERVVDHGLVVDRQQLLAGHERERVQAGARSAREDDAFHAKPFVREAMKTVLIIAASRPPVHLARNKSGFLDNPTISEDSRIACGLPRGSACQAYRACDNPYALIIGPALQFVI